MHPNTNSNASWNNTASGRIILSLCAVLVWLGCSVTGCKDDPVSSEEPDPIQAPFIDATGPSVKIVSPQNNASVTGVIMITVEANDNIAVDYVDIMVDAIVPPGTTEFNQPYEFVWDTSVLESGSTHVLEARAFDTSGNSTVSVPISITVESAGAGMTGVVLNEDLSSRQIFPDDNWWNLDISQAPRDQHSQAYIEWIGSTRELHADFGGSPWGIPYVTVPGDQALSSVHFYAYAGESDVGAPGRPPGYPVPKEAYLAGGYIEGGLAGGGDYGDRHLLIIDRDNWILYELFGTHWDAAGQRWEAASGAVFDLASNDRRPEGWTSTDAAGLAVFPGLLRFDEVYGAGEIDHALRFTARATNGHVWPASHSAGSTSGSLPLGARLRLKPDINVSGYSPEVQKILRAMKKHGLILADNGSDMFIQGTMDERWNMSLLNGALSRLTAADYEVIELGWNPLME